MYKKEMLKKTVSDFSLKSQRTERRCIERKMQLDQKSLLEKSCTYYRSQNATGRFT